MHHRLRALLEFCLRGNISRKHSSDRSNFDSLCALMSVISVSYIIGSLRRVLETWKDHLFIKSQTSVILFRYWGVSPGCIPRNIVERCTDESPAVGGFNYQRRNENIPFRFFILGKAVCGRTRQVTVRIIAPRGVFAKCARYPTRRCVIEQRNDLTLIECLRIWSRICLR